MTGAVSKHSAKDFTVLVAHSFSHMQKNRVVDLLNMDPVQGSNIRLYIRKHRLVDPFVSRMNHKKTLLFFCAYFTCLSKGFQCVGCPAVAMNHP